MFSVAGWEKFKQLTINQIRDKTYELFKASNPELFDSEGKPITQVEILTDEEIMARVNAYCEAVKDRPMSEGWSWNTPVLTITPVPEMKTVITLTIVATRKRKDNRGRGNSMRKKKRALRFYK